MRRRDAWFDWRAGVKMLIHSFQRAEEADETAAQVGRREARLTEVAMPEVIA